MQVRDNRRLYLKRAVFAFAVIVTAVLQNTKGAVPALGGVHAMIAVPLIVCIAMFDKSIPSILFAFFAGVMLDMTSITADGFFGGALIIVAFTVSILSVFLIRNNIFSCLLMSFFSIAFVNTMYWLLFIVILKADSPVYIYFRYYFPSVFYTFAFTPVYYYLIKLVSDKTAPERRRINY